MSKKKTSDYPIIEKVFSKKYGCQLTKSDAYFDEKTQDWLNEKIEQNLKNNKQWNKKTE